MSETDFDIYVVQDPDSYLYLPPDSDRKGDLQGQLYNLYKFFSGRGDHPIYVKNIKDFVLQVTVQVLIKRQATFASGATAKIGTLVIAAHGAPGVFYIGSTPVNGDKDDLAELRKLAPFFARDANVYILACRCGQTQDLLVKLSGALGGVKVHGYTDYIVTKDYGFKATLNDGTEDGGKHLVCLRSGRCTETKDPIPLSRDVDLGPPFERRR